MTRNFTALPDGAACGAVPSPLGPFTLVCTADGLLAVRYPGAPPLPRPSSSDPAALTMLDRARDELAAYFAGTLRRFTLPIAAPGTPFQRAVWAAVAAVPYGETRTYGQIATALGRPQAQRAVGHANGTNPLPIVIPCHRLVGADGALRGYGGGLPMKRWLLEHERGCGL